MIKRMVLITDILILLLFGPGIILLCLYWPVFMSNMRILRNAGFIVGGVWTLLGICFFLNVISHYRKRLGSHLSFYVRFCQVVLWYF